jgi:NAD(P)-dependent dehydrogenase (short-subunit alcohol dehydrogenase family)
MNKPMEVLNVSESSALEGKVILVTGGGRGLGAAICNMLAMEKATVIVGDVQPGAADQTVEALRRNEGVTTHALTFDVGDPAGAKHAIEDVVRTFGRLDVLINNAGVDVTCPVEELSVPDWDRVLHTNLYGPFLLAKYATPYMQLQGGGQIVNIVSTAAKRAWPNATAYHASKWGLLGLSHALHAELRPHGIKVTAVVAGGMRTPFLFDRFPDIDPSVLQDPINVARTVRFVLSMPDDTVIPEVMVLPMRETSWP